MSGAISYRESTARERIARFFDAGSLEEWLPPSARMSSPHLPALGLPVAFDDGVVVGAAALLGRRVLFAAQEPAFMGGAVGEVHGAKLTGLLRRAVTDRPDGVVLMFDTGGVRLHEANAGLIAISEIQRALFDARRAGVPVVLVAAGANGCYGGLSIVGRSADAIVMTEEGRLSVSGPEVIESQHGVEEFDARDRALVWRTMGGKHRWLIGEADALVEDAFGPLREATARALATRVPIDLATVRAAHEALGRRLRRFGAMTEAVEIWRELGLPDPDGVPMAEVAELVARADALREHGRG
jgi:malonate decarboxylase beta subunit